MPQLKTHTLIFITCTGIMSSLGCIPEQRRGADPPVLIEDDPVDASADTRRPLDAGDAGDAGGAGDAADVADVADVADAGGAADTDAAPSCEDECEQAGSLCDGVGATRSCGQFDEDPCLDLGEPSACSETQACDGGECVATCADECASGETSCGADGGTLSCGNFDADACLEWGGASACGASERCEEGACVPTADPCVDTCQADGDVVCSGVFRRTCGQHDSDSCLELGPVRSCPAGQECQGDGSCVPSCADECARGASRCLSGGVQTCGQFDSDACLDLSSPSPCGAGYACLSGACVQTCADECAQGQAICGSNGVRTCGDFDADPCLELGADVACPAGSACQGGACAVTCADECSATGQPGCADANSARTCGDYDLDSCLEWSAPTPCAANEICDVDACVPIPGCPGGCPAGLVCSHSSCVPPDTCYQALSLTCDVFEQAYIKAVPSRPWHLFGRSIALDGDTLVVGVPNEGTGGGASGAALVYTRSGSTWSFVTMLKESTPRAGVRFGSAVAIDGDRIAVGASHGNDPDVYVFEKVAGAWVEVANLGGGQPWPRWFGDVIALEGDQLLVGEPGNGFGQVYAFTRQQSNGAWVLRSTLPAITPGVNYREFGAAVAVSGLRFVAGAPSDVSSSASSNRIGLVFSYTRLPHTNWSPEPSGVISASNAENDDLFGASVALDGDVLVVGAPDEGGGSNSPGVNFWPSSGAAYVFRRVGGAWVEEAYLKASDLKLGDHFGSSVAISGNLIAVGASGEDGADVGLEGEGSATALDSGAVYLFEYDGSSWNQIARIKASNTDAADGFGQPLVLEGDTLVIGAVSEDSAASGIDGDQSNDASTNSGAVYVRRVK